MAKPHLWRSKCLGRFGHLILGILTFVITLLYTHSVLAQTPTITLSVPANSQFEEGEGNTTVVVTATLSAARGTPTVIDLSLAGTSKSTDYTTVTLPDITIPANEREGTADLILGPTDDIFFEGQETVKINGSANGVTVTSVDVRLIDNDAKPTLNIWLSCCSSNNASFQESKKVSTSLEATLTGGSVFEEDVTVTVSLDLEKAAANDRPSLSDLNFGKDDPPWEFTIPAGSTSGRRELTFTIVDDDIREDRYEHVYFEFALMAGGEDFTKSIRPFSIQPSDGPFEIIPNCHRNGYIYPGSTFTQECSLVATQKAPTKYTVTFTAEDPNVIDPDTFTLTLEQGATESPGVDITFITTDKAPTRVGYNTTVNPDNLENRPNSVGFNFFPPLDPNYSNSR